MKGQKKKCKDHLGNEYNSITEMCRSYGIKRTEYYKRLKRGWSLEETLTREVKNRGECRRKKCKDHLGNEYNSRDELCKAYGISYNTFKSRIALGWSLEKALTTPLSNGKKCKDHLGNTYNSISEMCEAHNIHRRTFKYRLKHGCTLEEALTKNLKNCKCKDHLGNEYNTITEMCDAYNIHQNTFRYRLKHGCTLEETLTNPICAGGHYPKRDTIKSLI